jgi:hypothetical protein
MTADASRIYFAARGKLVPGQPGGIVSLYLWDRGTVRFVANIENAPPDTNNWTQGKGGSSRLARVSPDGRYLLFTSGATLTGGITPPLSAGQIFRYDAEQDAIDCVSCPTDGSPVRNGATIDARQTGNTDYLPRALLADGSAVFETAQRLVREDVNGVSDVYLWREA